MQSDFSLFRERLAEACRVRGTKPDAVCRSIGLGSRHRVDLAYSGLKALDIYRLAQIADYLNVSVDWLLGRSEPKAKLTGAAVCSYYVLMPTPAPVEPPSPENVHLYRAACLAYRKTWRDELRRHDGNHKLVNLRAPLHAAALAVRELAPEMTFDDQRGACRTSLP